MHYSRIVNRDIKQDNIMINYNVKDQDKDKGKEQDKDRKDQGKDQGKGKEQDKMQNEKERNNISIRYIDFGLSTILTPKYCQNINNIDLRGTNWLISPELIMTFYITDNKNYDKIK